MCRNRDWLCSWRVFRCAAIVVLGFGFSANVYCIAQLPGQQADDSSLNPTENRQSMVTERVRHAGFEAELAFRGTACRYRKVLNRLHVMLNQPGCAVRNVAFQCFQS